MSEAVILDIENYLDSKEDYIPFATGKNIGRTVDYVAGRNRYTGYIISLAKHSYKGYRIGIDASNGSTWMLAKNIFDTLGAKTYVINNEPDGLNINLDCGSTHIEHLSNLVRENNLDIGFAFDGDADRCLAVDEKGNILTGDHILYFCGLYMNKLNELDKNTVVATVMSNMGLEKALSENGIKVEKTDVGDKYVYEAMIREGYCLGGEESGHIIFSKFASTGDGLITALKIMEVLIESKLEASKLTDGFKMYPQKVKNVRVSDKDKIMNNPEIKNLVSKVSKELTNKGRVLLRKSGTEPVIRVMVEAETDELCEVYTDKIANEVIKIEKM